MSLRSKPGSSGSTAQHSPIYPSRLPVLHQAVSELIKLASISVKIQQNTMIICREMRLCFCCELILNSSKLFDMRTYCIE